MSNSSLVMAAWRSRLRCSVRAEIISPAFSVAAFMLVMREACSLVKASLRIMNTRLRRYSGSSTPNSSSWLGSQM